MTRQPQLDHKQTYPYRDGGDTPRLRQEVRQQ